MERGKETGVEQDLIGHHGARTGGLRGAGDWRFVSRLSGLEWRLWKGAFGDMTRPTIDTDWIDTSLDSVEAARNTGVHKDTTLSTFLLDGGVPCKTE